jgi:hypothetical protein
MSPEPVVDVLRSLVRSVGRAVDRWCLHAALVVSLVVIGLFALFWEPYAVLMLLVASTGLTGLVLACAARHSDRTWPPVVAPCARRLRGGPRKRFLLVTASLGAIALGIGLVLSVIPSLVVLGFEVAFVVWASRALRRRASGRRTDRRPAPVTTTRPEAPATCSTCSAQGADWVIDFDDHELSRAWRRSYASVTTERHDVDPMWVVAVRQVYLDELERRAPHEFQLWLHSGPRASDGFEPFLGPGADH